MWEAGAERKVELKISDIASLNKVTLKVKRPLSPPRFLYAL
jgi:hypothetical protein